MAALFAVRKGNLPLKRDNNMAKIVVLGSGGWGMALALCACRSGHKVTLWTPFDNERQELTLNRGNQRLLKDVFLPNEIEITGDITVCTDALVTIIATPSFAVCETAKRLAQINKRGIVVNVAKGLEKGTLLRLSQVIKRELPNCSVVALSGPSHAEEVARGIPTSLVAASTDPIAAQVVQEVMSNNTLRIYTNDDVTGVELGGALKNVIAVAAGFCDGMGLGDNSKAALITRGAAEIARIGVCMGANEHTFAGLAGIGDLIVTCTSVHSRNHRFGELVGRGESVENALNIVGTVEGYYATELAFTLAQNYDIEMPITAQCYAVLYGNSSVKETVEALMRRPMIKE